MERYHRQLILDAVGPEGQARLGAAHALVVGCGGLGAPVIQYLAAAGIGTLTLVDDDVVEVSNLNRQVLHRTADVGRPKAERAAEAVSALNPDVHVTAHIERVAPRNVARFFGAADLVVDCTDGLPSKYLLNDAAVVHQRPLVHGAVTAFAGQVMGVSASGAPCLRCLFPDIPGPGAVPTCQTAGILGSAAGAIGSIMATEALKVVAGFGEPLTGRFLTYDATTHRTHVFDVPASASCPACGEAPRVFADRDADYRPGASAA